MPTQRTAKLSPSWTVRRPPLSSPSRCSFRASRLSCLIVAIGAQNAPLLLRQGLRPSTWEAWCCSAAADAVLIAAGVMGMAQALGAEPEPGAPSPSSGRGVPGDLRLAGITARQVHRLDASAAGTSLSLAAAVAQGGRLHAAESACLPGTPCCWSAASAPSNRRLLRGWFIAGAGAGLVWFSLLGFGARWLAPWFTRPRAWQTLDGSPV